MTAPHQYTLAEIRNGTGFPRNARFILAQPTDQDVVDAIATLLGTSETWTASDLLSDIANLIGQTRPHPGLSSRTYADDFRDATGRDVVSDWNQEA